MAARLENRLAAPLLADLLENPRVADGGAPDHQAARPGQREDFGCFRGGADVAIGQHRAGQRLDRAGDEIVVDRAAVTLGDGAAVDRHEIERVPGEDREQLVEDRGIVEAEPRLDGELHAHRLA